jgi:hypothetical protein
MRINPCMPPLLEVERETLNTQYSGLLCESIVRTYFISKQINVAVPDVDNGVDFLVLKDDKVEKIQVKKIISRIKDDLQIYLFPYQGSARRKQKVAGNIDYFYHVLYTPYRQLIFETPESMIPLRENGEYIHSKGAVLDRDSWRRKLAEYDCNTLLIHAHYDPIIYQSFPSFFI